MSTSLSLTYKDGKKLLVVETMEIETKAQAKELSALLETWGESLPETLPRTRQHAKKVAARSRARSEARRGRRAVNGETTATAATAPAD